MGGENGIGQLRLFGLRKERRLIMVAGLMEVCAANLYPLELNKEIIILVQFFGWQSAHKI